MKSLFVIANSLMVVLLAGCAATTKQHIPTPSSSSSYACETTQAARAPALGWGGFGCHFRLYHSTTRQILPNTPYRLTLYPEAINRKSPPDPIFTFDGITDEQGRSVYVRSLVAITPNRIEFVERIGDGAYGTLPRLISPIDGLPIPGKHYVVQWCGKPYIGVTDEKGNGVAFRTDNSNCNIAVKFYAPPK